MAEPSRGSGDLSNTTVAILLLLVIGVSIVGTWTVLDSSKSASGAPEVVLQAEQAEIRLMGSAVLSVEENAEEQAPGAP